MSNIPPAIASALRSLAAFNLDRTMGATVTLKFKGLHIEVWCETLSICIYFIRSCMIPLRLLLKMIVVTSKSVGI